MKMSDNGTEIGPCDHETQAWCLACVCRLWRQYCLQHEVLMKAGEILEDHDWSDPDVATLVELTEEIHKIYGEL